MLFRSALLLLILGGLLYAGGEAYKQTNTWKNLEREDGTDIFRNLPETVDIAVFGASHGREDFKFPPEGKTLFNFSMSPQNLMDPDLGLYLRGRLSPLLTEDFPALAAAFTEDVPLEPTIDEESGHNRITPELAQARKPRVFDLQISHVTACFPEANPQLTDAYREMLALCREKGWRAVLAVPPYLKEYTDCFTEFSPDYFDVQREIMEPLAREYGAAYLDYSHDPDFACRHEYYRDMSHMNLEGAEAFCRQFYASLETLAGF